MGLLFSVVREFTTLFSKRTHICTFLVYIGNLDIIYDYGDRSFYSGMFSGWQQKDYIPFFQLKFSVLVGTGRIEKKTKPKSPGVMHQTCTHAPNGWSIRRKKSKTPKLSRVIGSVFSSCPDG